MTTTTTTTTTPRLRNLAVLAAAIAVPRLLYLWASVDDDDGVRAVAFWVDCVCLLLSAWVIWPLQRDFGVDETRLWARVSSLGFGCDAATTFVGGFTDELHWLFSVVALVLWIAGFTRWLSALCERWGADYFVYKLWLVAYVGSHVLRFFQPEWPVFFFSFTLLLLALAAQVLVVGRAIANGKGPVAPP